MRVSRDAGWQSPHPACEESQAATNTMCDACETSLVDHLVATGQIEDPSPPQPHRTPGITQRVVDVAAKADATYGNFASAHEGWGVLAEELQELLQAIILRQGDSARADAIEAEAVDCAAVCLRLARQARGLTR